jgi:hypothetical protein
MPTIIQEDSSADDRIEGQRGIIREALDDIAREVGSRLQEAGLNVPMFLSVPSTGEGKAILTLASPIDSSEGDWLSVSAIVCEIAGKRLNGIILIGQEIRSAMSNVPKMKVAEVTAD